MLCERVSVVRWGTNSRFALQIVYEDDKVIAFLDKFPQVQGHTLVVPKEQVVKVHEMRSAIALPKAPRWRLL
jgi:hypothetical protein